VESELVIAQQNSIADLEEKLTKLQTKYEKLMNKSLGCLPPSIRKEQLDCIARLMDNLEDTICRMRENGG